MNKPIRIGMVGLGKIAGSIYLPLLAQSGRHELVGLYSTNQEKLKLLADAWRIPSYASLEELANNCDAVFVHSPTPSHYEIIKKLLHLGKHVYVDKPLAQTVKEAEELVALATGKQLILMVGFNRRFAPNYRALKEKITPKSLLHFKKHRDNRSDAKYNFTILLDDYIHAIDTMLWLAGRDVKIIEGKTQVDDKGSLLWAEHTFQSGLGRFTTSMHRHSGANWEQMEMISDEGFFHVNNTSHFYMINKNGRQDIDIPNALGKAKEYGFVDCVDHFFDCLEKGEKPLTSGEQAYRAQEFIESLYPKELR